MKLPRVRGTTQPLRCSGQHWYRSCSSRRDEPRASVAVRASRPSGLTLRQSCDQQPHPERRDLARGGAPRDRATLIGDSSGYVTKCSGEGINFAAKNGRMFAVSIVERSENDTRMITDRDLFDYISKLDAKYGLTYLVSDALQKLFYNRTRPASALWTCARRGI